MIKNICKAENNFITDKEAIEIYTNGLEIYKKYNGCKIAVMAKIGTVTINDFIKKKNSNITMVRVLINRSTQENGVQKSYYNHSDIREAKNFCKQLIEVI